MNRNARWRVYITEEDNETLEKIAEMEGSPSVQFLVQNNKPHYPNITRKSKLHVGTMIFIEPDVQSDGCIESLFTGGATTSASSKSKNGTRSARSKSKNGTRSVFENNSGGTWSNLLHFVNSNNKTQNFYCAGTSARSKSKNTTTTATTSSTLFTGGATTTARRTCSNLLHFVNSHNN